jgi:type VI secretion system protein ImpF
MADTTITERLQPSLLDRLTDEEPTRQSETRDDWLIDMRRLREIIRRDLAFLLNATNAGAAIDPVRHPHAARSTLNYGVDDVAGQISSTARASRLRQALVRAVETFEPRIHPGTLVVTTGQSATGSDAVVVFDIRADMWAQPMPMELYLRTQIDVTTGDVVVERTG